MAAGDDETPDRKTADGPRCRKNKRPNLPGLEWSAYGPKMKESLSYPDKPQPLQPKPVPLTTMPVRHEVLDYWWLKVPLGKRRPSVFHTESWALVGNGMS